MKMILAIIIDHIFYYRCDKDQQQLAGIVFFT
jgi:hypothetical protein